MGSEETGEGGNNDNNNKGGFNCCRFGARVPTIDGIVAVAAPARVRGARDRPGETRCGEEGRGHRNIVAAVRRPSGN